MNTPLILSIDTSTENCSVALSKGEELLSLREECGPSIHATYLTTFIQDCLVDSSCSIQDLDAVAVSIGPGSYTGLRIGLSTAKGICYASQKPLIAVSTLESLAFAARLAHPGANAYVSMMDARRNDAYVKVFDANLEVLSPDSMITIDQDFIESLPLGVVVFSGNAASKAKLLKKNNSSVFLNLKCSAQNLIFRAYLLYLQSKFINQAYIEPFYLLEPNITIKKK